MKNFLEKLIPVFSKISNLRVLKSITGGFFFAMPIVILGAVFQIVSNIAAAANGGQAGEFAVLTNLTFGLMGLFIAFGIAHTHAKTLNIDPMSTAVVGTSVFLMLSNPVFIEQGPLSTAFQIDAGRLGAAGMLIAVLSGILTAEVIAFFDRRGWVIKSDSLPSFARNWFNSLIPSVLLVLVAWAITYPLNFDVTSEISGFTSSILSISDTYWAFVGLWTFATFLFVIGIHPIGIIAAFMPLLIGALAENAELAASGLAPIHINNMGTAFAFIFLGGVGSTLALNFLMFRSKSATIKSLSKVAIVPSILNINEPLIFGLPIAFNPILAIPFILNGGIINPTLVFLAMKTGLVAMPQTMTMIPFLPAGLGGFLITNDWKSFILVAVLLVVNAFVWLPFFKFHEKQTMEKEAAPDAEV